MKSKLKLLLLWLAVFAACFVIIYLIVFFGGAKLFESGDPILIELGAALVCIRDPPCHGGAIQAD